MQVVYRCEWAEFIVGQGWRNDGVTYALSETLLFEAIQQRRNAADRREFCKPSEITMAVVSPELAKKIYSNGGVYSTTDKDDAGYFGKFIPRDPKANIRTYREGMELSHDQAAHAAEMTGTS